MTKHRYSRRGFVGLSGAGIAGLLGSQWPGGIAAADTSTQDPDLVVFNAKVYTIDPLEPRAERLPSRPAGSSRWGAAMRSGR